MGLRGHLETQLVKIKLLEDQDLPRKPLKTSNISRCQDTHVLEAQVRTILISTPTYYTFSESVR